MGCATDSRAADPTWWDSTNITGDTTEMFAHGWWQACSTTPSSATATSLAWTTC
ncbi:MAG: hypothetical protein R3F59_25045 [Myxococcota bacterium]